MKQLDAVSLAELLAAGPTTVLDMAGRDGAVGCV